MPEIMLILCNNINIYTGEYMLINILSISTSTRYQQTADYYLGHHWTVKRYNNDGKFPSYGRNVILEDFDKDIKIKDEWFLPLWAES